MNSPLMQSNVTIIDYGMGNLYSIENAVRNCGSIPTRTSIPTEIANANRLILPGVGAFGLGMSELSQRGLIEPIKAFSKQGKPVLGICLGMQLLFTKSGEFGEHDGLNIIPEIIVPIPEFNHQGRANVVPHVGWNELLLPEHKQQNSWQDTILKDIPVGSSVYFVHSFFADCASTSYEISDCEYNDMRIPSVVKVNNTFGCQFHPEKSGPIGLKILNNFLSLP